MKAKLPPPPVFDTPEEEDEFWQTHSPLDFKHEDIGIPVPRKFLRPEVELTIRLSLEDQKLLNRIAEQKGEPLVNLVQRYIQGGLRADLEGLNTSE